MPLRLSRRTFLRGGAVAVGLPPLEAMMDGRGRYHAIGGSALAAAAKPPVRLFTWFFPNGRPGKTDAWVPAADGTAWTPSPCLMSLAPLKADVTVLTNVDNTAGMQVPGAHEPGDGSFATGMPVDHSANGSWGGYQARGPSFEQVAAQRLGAAATRFPSLCASSYVGTLPGYTSTISWADAGKPIAPERDPKALYDRLFSATGGGTGAAPAPSYDRSVLDYVGARITRLQGRLGAQDRQRLDAHLTGVRELERQIALRPALDCRQQPPAASDPMPDFTTKAHLFAQLLAYAIRCDLTRFGSFMHGSAISTAKPLPGMPNHHHGISHDGPYDWYVKITAYHVECFAYFASLLQATPEGAGTLLDNTLVYFSSELADGARHSKDNVPIVIAGRGGGQVASGRHLRLPAGRWSTNAVFMALLSYAGAPVSSFGVDGKEPLPGLSA